MPVQVFEQIKAIGGYDKLIGKLKNLKPSDGEVNPDQREIAYKLYTQHAKNKQRLSVLPTLTTKTNQDLFAKFDCIQTPNFQDFFVNDVSDVKILTDKLKAIAASKRFLLVRKQAQDKLNVF